MKLFADTADLRELKELDEMGLICGITTNPTIASQTGKNLVDEMCIRDRLRSSRLWAEF